jgi:hypothetical protein
MSSEVPDDELQAMDSHRLLLDDDDCAETKSKHSERRDSQVKLLWVAMMLLTVCVFIIGYIRLRANQCSKQEDIVRFSSTEFGTSRSLDTIAIGTAQYITDFVTGPANTSVDMVRVRFTSGIRHAANGTLFRTNPERMAFVGPPSAEIDKAWDTLTHG